MVVKFLRQIIMKGEQIAIIGISASGKSTFIEKLANRKEIKKILRRRLAHGKGTLTNTRIIITDYKDVPEDAVIICGMIPKIEMMDIYDDNKLLGWILYMAIKDYYKNNTDCDDFKRYQFTEDIVKYFKERQEDKDNDTLQFKLRRLGTESAKELLSSLMSLDVTHLGMIYEQMLDETTKSKSTNAKVKIFTDLLIKAAQNSNELNEAIRYFWYQAVEYINYELKRIKQNIDTYNFERGYSSDVTIIDNFEMLVREKDLDNEIVQELLDGENKGLEVFIKDLALVFRNDELLSRDNNNILSVMEIGNITVKNLCFVDTMGLFHSQDVTAEEEKERIIDILEKHHCDKVIFTSNSVGDVVVKNGMDAISLFYRHSKKAIKTYFIFTHFDMLLLNAKKESIEMDYAIEGFEKDAYDYVADYLYTIEASIESNTSKFKPSMPVMQTCGMLCGDAGSKYSIDDVLNKNNTYQAAIDYIVDDIINKSGKNVYKIHDAKDVTCYLEVSTDKHDFSKIVLNILDCKNDCEIFAPIHPAWNTVEAILRHWREEGMEFESRALGYDTGYSPTSSYFVRYIKSFVDSFISDRIYVNTDGLNLLNPDEKKKFADDIKLYFKQELGTECVKLMYNDIAKRMNQSHISHYTYLHEFLYNLQSRYFQYKSMPLINELFGVIDEAKNQCKKNFINEKCIEVY